MTTRILIKSNGSIKVMGDDFEIVDQDGNKFELYGRTKVSLCRCGQSNNKPFCDSTHKTCGWQSTIVAFSLEPNPDPSANDKL